MCPTTTSLKEKLDQSGSSYNSCSQQIIASSQDALNHVTRTKPLLQLLRLSFTSLPYIYLCPLAPRWLFLARKPLDDSIRLIFREFSRPAAAFCIAPWEYFEPGRNLRGHLVLFCRCHSPVRCCCSASAWRQPGSRRIANRNRLDRPRATARM